MNQVQLRILTTAILGNHDEIGRPLAIYAAVTDVVRNRLLSRAGRGDRLMKKQWPQIKERLEQHFEMAEYISDTLLSHGQSHEFGDYREQSALVYGLRSLPGESNKEALKGPSRTIPAHVERWLGSRREQDGVQPKRLPRR